MCDEAMKEIGEDNSDKDNEAEDEAEVVHRPRHSQPTQERWHNPELYPVLTKNIYCPKVLCITQGKQKK